MYQCFRAQWLMLERNKFELVGRMMLHQAVKSIHLFRQKQMRCVGICFLETLRLCLIHLQDGESVARRLRREALTILVMTSTPQPSH